MTSAVVVADLVKRFPASTGYRQLLPWRPRREVTALDGVSLQVAEGELFGLLGPNGAGKTTLMKVLSTLVLPTSGRALVCDRDVVAEDAAVRGLVGLITADERSFYWRLTGRQNLRFFAALYQLGKREGQRRVDELLEMLGLAQDADRPFQSYSTGMRQKVAIARGLLPDPRVLLVDEPTRSLDPISAMAVRCFLKEKVATAGCTVLLATHQMAEAEQLCDRVAVLHHGRVLACGTVAELRLARRRDLCHLEVSGLAGDPWTAFSRLPGVSDLRATPGEDGVVTLEVGVSDSRAVLPRLIAAVLAVGGSIHDCSVRQRPLEEIFIDLVRQTPSEGTGPSSGEPLALGAETAC